MGEPRVVPHLEGGIVQQQKVRITDIDSRRLWSVIEDSPSMDRRDVDSVASLERQLADAKVMPANRIGPEIVTINSEVRVRNLDTHETMAFRVVLPRAADASARRISVLAPLGRAVLGRKVGDHVAWRTPGGLRRLRVDGVLYQPERVGIDLG